MSYAFRLSRFTAINPWHPCYNYYIIYAKYNNYYDTSDLVILSEHLGQIADCMYEWEGVVADGLGLTLSDIAAIKMKYPLRLDLQT